MLETTKRELKVNCDMQNIKVKNAIIDPTPTRETPDSARYFFTG